MMQRRSPETIASLKRKIIGDSRERERQVKKLIELVLAAALEKRKSD